MRSVAGGQKWHLTRQSEIFFPEAMNIKEIEAERTDQAWMDRRSGKRGYSEKEKAGRVVRNESLSVRDPEKKKDAADGDDKKI